MGKKTSKVKEIKGPWEPWVNKKSGDTLYPFTYTMEDGAKFEANHKTEVSPFPVGTEAEYEITNNSGRMAKGKIGKPFSGGGARRGGGDPVGMMVGNAMTNAVTMATTTLQTDKITPARIEEIARELCNISIKLKDEFKLKSE